MPEQQSLGSFLRARRAAVDPQGFGIVDPRPRRVTGLRREELADLAGVSVDYYTRLEQGRDQHPSPQVPEALAGPLGLDRAALAYARALAAPLTPHPAPTRVKPGLLRVLTQLDRAPALVFGRLRDVLAANALACALNPGFAVGTDFTRFVFLDPRARETYREWDEVAAEAVRMLRLSAAGALDDRQLTQRVELLSADSDEFARLWADQDVREKQPGTKRFAHPEVGDLTLEYEIFDVAGSAGQTLSVYHAEADSEDARALERLAESAGVTGQPVQDDRQRVV